MVTSISTIPTADYFINRDPWLRRLGGREAGKRISEQLYECCPPILRGRPIYDRLPGAAEAYNKDSNTFIAQGTIILPEAQTVISDAEDVYFRERFPEEYAQRDYVKGSQLGPGSVAALFEDSRQAVKVGDTVSNRSILVRSGIFLWADDIVRDETEIAKQTIEFPGMTIMLPQNGSGWFWIDGNGNLNVTDGLPDGVANLSGNIWCDPAAVANLGESACVRRINVFQRDENLRDTFDVGLTDEEITWPPTEECEEPKFTEVSPIFRYVISNGVVEVWEDYRRFNRGFDLPVARYLMDYWDNVLQEKREQIDTFVDDALIPDTIGFNFLGCDTSLRQSYRNQTFDQILDAWDFGLIDGDAVETVFDFLTPLQLNELARYDALTHLWLDWLAQHFGFQDNATLNENVWHDGSQFDGTAQNEVFYTIAEKRAILRNALGQDPFQTVIPAGTVVIDFPIWNLFEELWGLTEVFWNGTAEIPSNEVEFIFSRFPFVTFNRLTPDNWEGLLKAKGTVNSLLFMFDTLGLHGYACNQDTPRLYDITADFQTPLIPLKPVNSALISTIKTLDENGNVIEVLDDSGNPTYRIGNYSITGYVRTGETVFSTDYDRKLVVRAPFSWGRTSQKWNRLQEISKTYVREGTLVTGYYNYLTGQSAAGEPVWYPEDCTACEYVVTSHLYDSASFYGSDDENIGSEFTWVQNMTDDNVWNNVGYERGANLAYNLVTYPIYVEDRTILAIVSEENNHDVTKRNNAGLEFPLVASYDNGITFEPINTNYDNASAPNPISFGRKLRHVAGNTFLVAEDIIIFSQDAGINWFGFNTTGISGQLFDIFPNPDTRRLYVVSSDGIYSRLDTETTFTLLNTFPIDDPTDLLVDAVVRVRENVVAVMYTVVNTSNELYVRTATMEFDGASIFVNYTQDLGLDTAIGTFKLRTGNITRNDQFIVELDNQWYFYTDDIQEYFVTNLRFGDSTDNSAVFATIYSQILLDYPTYSTFETTDIRFNQNSSRFEFLITIDDPALTPFGAIYSIGLNLDDPTQENFGINLIEGETKTGDFIIKRIQVQDIDATIIDEPITFVNVAKRDVISSDPSIPVDLFYYNVDSFDVSIPCIDINHPEYPLTFFPNEDDKRNIVAINSSRYLSGANYFNYELPTVAPDIQFTVTNEDLTNTATTPEFEPSDNSWSILQVSCTKDPTDEKTTDLPAVGNYTEVSSVDGTNFQMRGHTLNDQATIFFKVNPYFGYYVNNYYPNSTDTYSNVVTVPYANHVPPNIDFSLVTSIDAELFIMSPHEDLLGTEIVYIHDGTIPGANFSISVPNIDTINQNFNFVVTAQYNTTSGIATTVAFKVHLEPSTGGP